jgi:hypothetical protein
MSLSEFQRALASMTLDTTLARRVREQGAAALRGFALRPRDLDRLVRVAAQPGMALNCTLARSNRFTSIAESLPMTCAVLEPVLRELLDRLWAHDRPQGYQLSSELRPFIDRVQGDPALFERFPLLDDVLRYELACLALIDDARRLTLAAMSGRTRIIVLQHDPARLIEPLRAEQPVPVGLEREPHTVELELVDGALETRWWSA